MTRDQLISQLDQIMPILFGEQFSRWPDDDGDIHYLAYVGGTTVAVAAEPFGEDESVLCGFNVLAVQIEDQDVAATFVQNQNTLVRIGRFVLEEDGVMFTHQMFGAGVTVDSVRLLTTLLASARAFSAELCATAGALTLADLSALKNLDDF